MPGLVVGLSTATVFIGAFMPWFTVRAPFVGELSKSGTEGDGVITLILAVVAAVALFRWFNGSRTTGVATTFSIIGVLVTGIAIFDLVDATNRASDLSAKTDGLAQATPGAGLLVTLVGGIGLVLGAILAYNAAPVSEPPAAEAEGRPDDDTQ